MKRPHFALVHTNAGWLARFVAANGKEVWRTSESYKRRTDAVRAITLIAGQTAGRTDLGGTREVDERA